MFDPISCIIQIILHIPNGSHPMHSIQNIDIAIFIEIITFDDMIEDFLRIWSWEIMDLMTRPFSGMFVIYFKPIESHGRWGDSINTMILIYFKCI